jgi:hypothetical protein
MRLAESIVDLDLIIEQLRAAGPRALTSKGRLTRAASRLVSLLEKRAALLAQLRARR